MSHLTHPIITSNVDAIIRHQASYVNSNVDIVLEANERRTIVLSIFTTGATIQMGPGGTSDEPFGVGDDVENNFTTTLVNHPVIKNSVIIKIDGVQIGIDNGSGTIVGDPVPGSITGGTINYNTGALSVTFQSAPAQDAIISATYAGYIADKHTTITAPAGTVKWDLSGFLKNAPYCLGEEDYGFIVTPATSAETVVAYIQIRTP